ncbi:MAG TPA: YceI family protein [Kofleriaceae bacterium]|nr:YceI family protein [Kofleriaceae bacterium]
MKSPFAPVVLAVVALAAALARWTMQGSKNLYTATAKRFYIADPDLGYRVAPQHPLWVGLEVCAVILAIIVGLVIAGWIIRRREARRGAPSSVLRALTWLVAALTLVVPIWAFASGGAPAGALDTLPASTLQGIESGIAGLIDAPEGTYEVVAHPGTAVTAHLSAGHETFDARFASGIRGTWQGDPHDFTKPIGGSIEVDAAGVDTGIDERSNHARTEYIYSDKFPKITFAIDKVLAASQDGANAVKFRAHGTLGFVGKTHAIEVTGTLKKPDAAALARLNVGAGGDVLLAQADFALVIKDTALAADAKDFDGDKIPIHVSLVLRHTTH